MESNKEAFTLEEIFAKGFNLCKKNWLELLKLIAVFFIPVILLTVISVGTIVSFIVSLEYTNSYSYLAFGIGNIIVLMIVICLASLITMYGEASVITLLRDASNGKEVDWKSALMHVWEIKWRVLGLNILVYLMGIVLFTALGLIFMILTFLTLGIALFIIVPIGIVLSIILAPLTILFNSMLIVRNLTVIEAITKTFNLFLEKGYFLGTLGRVAAIGGVIVVGALVLSVFQIIPVLGMVIVVIGGEILQVYSIATCNLVIISRNIK